VGTPGPLVEKHESLLEFLAMHERLSTRS